jgi:GNAT superfamily N-acetyltransferase
MPLDIIPSNTERVRLATWEDAPEVMDICREVHEEIGIFDMSERKVREALDEAFFHRGGIVGVIGDPGNIEGCIMLRIGQLWYTEGWHLQEMFSFVRPEYRRSRNAIYLVDFAQKCAKELKLNLLIGILSDERTQAKIKLYERKIGRPAGAFFKFNGREEAVA